MDWKYVCQLRNVPCLLIPLLFFLSCSDGVVKRAPLLEGVKDCYNNYADTSLQNVVGESLCDYCEGPNVQGNQARSRPMSPSAKRYIDDLLDQLPIPVRGVKRRTRGRRCLRREYRTLSDRERNRLHWAINVLKNDTSVDPNKFDAIAGLHTGDLRFAHRGPNFFGFHRTLVLLFELALQHVDPDICVCYWDSTMDDGLDDPRLSYVFSPEFLGGRYSIGPVTDGPFAYWMTPFHGPLMRNIGVGGQMFPFEAVEDIMSRTRQSEINYPDAEARFNLELIHGYVHRFVGGQFLPTPTAAYDPVFIFHHCFIDYLWERFRNKQRKIGIDPQFDYPVNAGSVLHESYADLGFNLNVTAATAYLDILKESYEYVDSPVCDDQRPYCGYNRYNRYLTCDVERQRCIPVDPENSAPSQDFWTGSENFRIRRAVHQNVPRSINLRTASKSCKNKIFAIQNNFCIDGICDMRKWVYVAIKVISIRSPTVKVYDSYPVLNGQVSKRFDIYNPSAYTETNRFSSPTTGYPKGYDKCDDENGMGQVFVQSTGVNYEGFYKESALIDQRLTMAMSVTYIAVKNPRSGPVRALFRAFDSCGRVCRPACKVPGTHHYTTCEGVLDIADIKGQPKQYSRNYGQASVDTWTFDKSDDCPSLEDKDIALAFYCDYKNSLPWVEPVAAWRKANSNRSPHNRGQPSTHRLRAHRTENYNRGSNNQGRTYSHGRNAPGSRNYNQGHHNQRHTYSQGRKASHGSENSNRGSNNQGHTYSQGQGESIAQPCAATERGAAQGCSKCVIDAECTIDVSCSERWNTCVHRDAFRCRGSCNKFALCVDGKYTMRTCHRDLAFDDRRMECTTGRRCSSRRRNSNSPLDIVFILDNPVTKNNASSTTGR